MKQFRLVFIAAAVLGCLSACISIETTVELTAAGGGTLDLEYRVSKLVTQLKPWDKEGSLLPLPVNEADFRSAVSALPGLALRSYARSENEELVIIKASLGFDRIESLNGLVGRYDTVYQLRNEQGASVLDQLVSPGNPEGLDPETEGFFKTFFASNYLKFTVKAPRPISASSIPAASVQGNQASLSMNFTQVAAGREALRWSVRW
jgi:hypothetical protein